MPNSTLYSPKIATNNMSVVDGALIRPGRIDVRIKLDLPTRDTRRKILDKILAGKPVSQSPELINKILDKTKGCTPATLVQLYQEAVMHALRKDLESAMVNKTVAVS